MQESNSDKDFTMIDGENIEADSVVIVPTYGPDNSQSSEDIVVSRMDTNTDEQDTSMQTNDNVPPPSLNTYDKQFQESLAYAEFLKNRASAQNNAIDSSSSNQSRMDESDSDVEISLLSEADDTQSTSAGLLAKLNCCHSDSYGQGSKCLPENWSGSIKTTAIELSAIMAAFFVGAGLGALNAYISDVLSISSRFDDVIVENAIVGTFIGAGAGLFVALPVLYPKVKSGELSIAKAGLTMFAMVLAGGLTGATFGGFNGAFTTEFLQDNIGEVYTENAIMLGALAFAAALATYVGYKSTNSLNNCITERCNQSNYEPI